VKLEGIKPDGLEVGNAWDLHDKGDTTNWIVGVGKGIPTDSLRFMQREEKAIDGTRAKNIAVKWFVHSPSDSPDWGVKKPTSEGRTISLLAGDGEFEILFSKGNGQYKLTLDQPGNFAIWGPGLEHSWKPLKISTIVTIRWEPLDSVLGSRL
jgi:hypothetical protein